MKKVKKITLSLLAIGVIVIITTAVFVTISLANTANTPIAEVLTSVLNNEIKFITAKGDAVYLSDYAPYYVWGDTSYEKNGLFVPQKFCFLDLDGDGTAELVACGENYDYLVLRRQGKKIYGYSLEAKWLQSLRQDGSFISTDEASASDYNTFKFNKTKLQLNNLAKYHFVAENSDQNVFEIDGNTVSLDKIKAFKTEWENRPAAKWSYFVFDLSQNKNTVKLSDVKLNVTFKNDKKQLDITNKQNGKVIQTIAFETSEKITKNDYYSADINFDGFDDLLIPVEKPTAGLFFDAYYWNNSISKYVLLPDFRNYPNPAIDKENKVILSHRISDRYRNYYKFSFKGGSFKLVSHLNWAPASSKPNTAEENLNKIYVCETTYPDKKEYYVPKLATNPNEPNWYDDNIKALTAPNSYWDINSPKWTDYFYK